MRSASVIQVLLLVVLAITSSGCQVIGDIFQAGIWVGVIVVVIILAVVGFIVGKLRRR